MREERVRDVDVDGVSLVGDAGGGRRISARTVIWAAGVRALGLAGERAAAAGVDLGAAGHVVVEADLTLPHHPEGLIHGDMTRVRDGAGQIQHMPGQPTTPGSSPQMSTTRPRPLEPRVTFASPP